MNQTLAIPVWIPRKDLLRVVARKVSNKNQQRLLYKKIRNAATGYIKKPEVRSYIFNRDGNKCVYCGFNENLQVDHIISVYACSRGLITVYQLNDKSNLQTLCLKCNAAKCPG